MKHIVLILPSLRGGGAEKLNINLANYFINKNYKVTIIILNSKNDYKDIINRKIKIITLNSKRLINSFPKLIYYFYKIKPNYTIVSMWPLTCISVISWILSGKWGKLFVSEHNMLSIASIRELKISYFKIWLSITFTYNLCNKVIAVSKGVKNDLINISFLLKSKLTVIYNPIAFTFNELVLEDEKFKWDQSSFKILNIGSLIKQKDHNTLIDAFKIVLKSVDAQLVIIGEGNLYDDLNKKITDLNLKNKIIILPFKKNLSNFYKEADLFVLSSQWEGFGNVIVESLEMGTPVVSTKCKSGPSEIINSHDIGELVPINDPKNMALAILKSLRKKYNKNILINRAKDFSVEKIAKSYLRIFNEK